MSSRNAGRSQPGGVVGVADVAGLDPDGRHPGRLEELPRAGVAATVGEARAGDGLALDQVGQLLADRGPGPEPLLAEEERRDAASVLLVGGVAVQRQDDVGSALVGEQRAGLVVAGAGKPGPRVDDVGPVRAEAPLDAAGQVVDDLRLDDPVGDGTGVVAAVTRVQDDGPPAQAVPGPADVLALAQ